MTADERLVEVLRCALDEALRQYVAKNCLTAMSETGSKEAAMQRSMAGVRKAIGVWETLAEEMDGILDDRS